MEIPNNILEMLQSGSSLEELQAAVKELNLEEKVENNLSWDVEEAKIRHDLEQEKLQTATWLIYGSYGMILVAIYFLIRNQTTGASALWPILGLIFSFLIYRQGRNMQKQKITLGRERLINKGYFKKF